jgi:hypothetical protein
MEHGWLMKTKRGRAAVRRRPHWGKAAALPCQRTGLWGQERNLGLHEPAVPMELPMDIAPPFQPGFRFSRSKTIPNSSQHEFQGPS